jgi:hypothetical protein
VKSRAALQTLIAPAGVALTVGVFLRGLGMAAILLAWAAFLAVQLLVVVYLQWRLVAVKKRLNSIRARRALHPRVEATKD